MMAQLRVLALVLGGLIVFTACAPSSAAPTSSGASAPASHQVGTFRIAAVPSADSQQQVQGFGPFRDYLASKLDVDVEQFVASDYTSVIEAMRAKRIDAAWFGPFSYILAAQEANAQAVVAYIGANDLTTYRTWFIVPASSPIQTLDDLKARAGEITFAFVDPASTSGNLYPRKKLQEMGLNPDTDFAEAIFAGGHDASLLAVANGRVGAGVVCDNCAEGFLAQGIASRDAFRIIGESDPIPNDPWAVRRDLEPAFVEQFRQAMIEVSSNPAAIKALAAYSTLKGYQAIDDARYDTVRDTARLLNLDLAKMK
ncbi:MAG: phosphate/phosphite/phosphonate ABC transporter substrate-binding protein [Chloroflexi bacterium]|nr:phosphate/phosphite/phosphonate ABC transporter substrate-binding protein [Chloroflexota bacterium]